MTYRWISQACRSRKTGNRGITAVASALMGIAAGAVITLLFNPFGASTADASSQASDGISNTSASESSKNSGKLSAQRSALLVLKPIFRLPWGNDKHSAAKEDGNESASWGPSSFAVGNDGTFWLLDQLQYRLAQFDDKGRWLSEIPLESVTYDGLEIADDGSFVLLDKLGRRMVQVLDPRGNHKVKTDLQLPGEPESGHITAMFTLPDGIWVEYDNTYRKRVLDENYRPCERNEVRGRPVRPGIDLLGALTERGGADIWLEDRTGTGKTIKREVRADYDIARIITLQPDAIGQIHAVFHLMHFDHFDRTKLLREEVYGIVYDDGLRMKYVWHSPWVIRRWAQFTEVRVGKDGTIYQMGFDDGGVVLARGNWVTQ